MTFRPESPVDGAPVIPSAIAFNYRQGQIQ
jgi:hypothetical protein